jgi:Na+-translocating ferredoxin:NAD+ oxidoreductase subunit C
LLKKYFPGGVHPAYKKVLSKDAEIKPIGMPDQVMIPLIQHIGAPCKPVVKAGDRVKTGQLIAKSEKLISAPIHSSVSGKVKAIKKVSHPVLGICEAIIIDSDNNDEKAYSQENSYKSVDDLSPDDIKEKVQSAGIVGMGGAAFPTHVKLSPPKDKKIDTFILNGAECEPYLTCDDRMMQEHAEEIIKGMFLLMKVIGVKNGIIAIEDNKPLAIKAMRSGIANLQPVPQHSFEDSVLGDPEQKRGATCNLQLVTLPTKYPQGGEKQLIKALTGREVPPLKLPFDVGCIVDNVQTAYAVYEAVYRNKPLYERVITVTGDAIKEPSNVLVRLGTPVSFVIKECGGIKGQLGKLVIGGPMMGIAQYAMDIPIIKGVSGILFLSDTCSVSETGQYCIRCGKCKESCPVKLIPTEIAKASEYGRFEIATMLNAADCIECGCCSYVCPSRIPLVQLIKHAKRAITCQI